MGIEKSRRRLFIACIAVLLVAFCCFSETLSLGQKIYGVIPKIFIWNDTYSVPKGLYMIVPLGELSCGDYVVFSGTDDVRNLAIERGWIDEEEMFLKRVGALPGDSYKVDPVTKMFYVNRIYKGMVRNKDSDGRELPHRVKGVQVVPQDTFLPVGESSKSFDGRYYGTQPISTIRLKVVPVVTFD